MRRLLNRPSAARVGALAIALCLPCPLASAKPIRDSEPPHKTLRKKPGNGSEKRRRAKENVKKSSAKKDTDKARAALAPVPAPPPKPRTEAASVDPAVASLARFGLSIQRVSLDNGLRVVLNEDHSAPTVAVAVTYGVGSSSEVQGRTGFAHLFEHMMFQGSKHVKKGDHFTLISDRGGTLNGTTSSDRTNYFEVLPSNELKLALWLEADRMRWLAVTPENFENQRAVVQEEYRMRIENAAYMRGMLRLGELVFSDYPAYAHPTIGSMRDLDAAKFEWVKDFHDAYYAPDQAVLTVAGDFEADPTLELIRQYFGPAERKGTPKLELPALPEHASSGRASMEDSNARTPGFFYGFMIPPARTPEHYALELATVLLGDGESSRLYTKLVHDKAVAQRVSAWTDDHRGADQFGVMLVLTSKAKLTDVEALVANELEELRKKPPSKAELEKAKRRLRSSFVFGLQTNMGRATQLGEFETFWGDARLLARELERYLAVTPEQVQQAAQKYLSPERRSLVEVLPTGTTGKP